LTVKFPPATNIKFLIRDNKGYDFGAWGEGLKEAGIYEEDEISPYKFFILLNSSIRGPIVPKVLQNFIPNV
jgi:lipopolysaccharide biosynthesis protein